VLLEMHGESEKIQTIKNQTSFNIFLCSVANSVAIPAYMLQLMNTQQTTSITEITGSIFDDVQQEVFTKDKENFYVVG
jgi:hypothetical protein